MKIAICEDSQRDMERLKKAIEEASSQLLIQPETDAYDSGEELLCAVGNGETYSLLFLDIYMQDIDGVETARKVRTLLPEVQIVFLTTSREFMLEAFDLNALHYLMKPVSEENIKECMARFFERNKRPQKELVLKSYAREYRFPLLHVQQIISHNKGIDVYQKEQFPVHISMSFAMAVEQLDPLLFLKISRGFIVHMSFIRYMDRAVCHLKDGTEILLSRNEKEEIRRRYNDYLFQKQ